MKILVIEDNESVASGSGAKIPLFKNLEVAKKGEVHKVDDVIWNTAGGVKAANLMLDDIENTFLK